MSGGDGMVVAVMEVKVVLAVLVVVVMGYL